MGHFSFTYFESHINITTHNMRVFSHVRLLSLSRVLEKVSVLSSVSLTSAPSGAPLGQILRESRVLLVMGI